jgi:DNA adenine methylase
MLLRRHGNKSKIADKIIKEFPKHGYYIEPFFGAGGMFFNKPKAKFNILNDIDLDVYNLFNVVMNNNDELIQAFKAMPAHSELFNYWKNNTETEPIKKALRFLLLSNYSLFGSSNTFHLPNKNTSNILLENIKSKQEKLFGCDFTNCCFRELFIKISFSNIDMSNVLIYADPPYLGTGDNYSDSFIEQDCVDLIDVLMSTGANFAYSEFDNEFILQQAKERNLYVIVIGERRNINNRRTEILVTNYKNYPSLF